MKYIRWNALDEPSQTQQSQSSVSYHKVVTYRFSYGWALWNRPTILLNNNNNKKNYIYICNQFRQFECFYLNNLWMKPPHIISIPNSNNFNIQDFLIGISKNISINKLCLPSI